MSGRPPLTAHAQAMMDGMTPVEIALALAALRETLVQIDAGDVDATGAERAHLAGSIATLKLLAS